MAVRVISFARTVRPTANKGNTMAKRPKDPISQEAHKHLRGKLDRMKGIEKEKTIKRLEMYDRGYKKNDDFKVDRD